MPAVISVTKGRLELPRHKARRSERRVFANYTTWSCDHVSIDPHGNRTRLSSLRGWCPQPIDERAEQKSVEQELNLHSLWRVIYSHLGSPMPSRRMFGFASGTGGSRTRRSPRFELGRFAGLRTVPLLRASPTGFEPVISCLTGRRALQAAPRGRVFFFHWLRWDSNPQHPSF